MFHSAGMLSPDGRCKTLDASADGYVRAEGAAVAVLATLTHASGTHGPHAVPLALLAGAAVNQDGRSSSLTAPNGPSQQEVIAAALRAAGVQPGDVAALQTHGTGEANLL
jgi:acyl transferase domain-containing protein